MSVRVEVHTKTGKTLKGEPIGKWPAGAIGEFECWSERWNSIVVIRFFSESGNFERRYLPGSVTLEVGGEIVEERIV